MNDLYSLLDAWNAYEAGQYALAEQIFKALIEIAPDPDTRRNHALGYVQVLMAQQRWAEARELLQAMLTETGEAMYYHQLGLLERAAGRPEAALAQFRAETKLLQPEPFTQAINQQQLAQTALLLDRPQDAQTAAEAGLSFARASGDPSLEAGLHALLGEIAEAMGQLQRARECYADATVAYASAGDPEREQEMAEHIARL